jgi:hypothetical protein
VKTAIDPLSKVLARHIWYTVSTGNDGPQLICRCRARLRDTDEHAEHLASIARRHLGVQWSES